MTKPSRYRAYLLRLWQVVGNDSAPCWRAALEPARTGNRRGLADLAQLCALPEKQTANWTKRDPHTPAGEP